MMKFILKITSLILFYIVIFRPELKLLPFSVNVTFGIIGMIFYVLFHKEMLFSNSSSNGLRPIVASILPFVMVSLITGVLHPDGDWYFLKYGFSVILSYFSVFTPVFFLFKGCGEVKFATVVKYLVACNYIYIIVALAMFIIPDIREIALSLLEEEDNTLAALERTEGLRLQAFGTSFFNSGVIEGFFIILLALCVRVDIFNSRWKIFFIISILFFSFLGMLLARTTVIGIAVAFILLILYYARNTKRMFYEPIMAILLSAVFVGTFVISNPQLTKNFSDVMEWAFEAFYNYKNTGSFETYSSNKTISMYQIIPNDLSTWIIGDGQWIDKSGMGYYMGTDVGWTRQVFFFGLVGVFSMCFYYLKTLKLIYVKHLKSFWGSYGTVALYSFLLYTFLLNMKGFADIFYLSIVFYFCECTKRPNKVKYKSL